MGAISKTEAMLHNFPEYQEGVIVRFQKDIFGKDGVIQFGTLAVIEEIRIQENYIGLRMLSDYVNNKTVYWGVGFRMDDGKPKARLFGNNGELLLTDLLVIHNPRIYSELEELKKLQNTFSQKGSKRSTDSKKQLIVCLILALVMDVTLNQHFQNSSLKGIINIATFLLVLFFILRSIGVSFISYARTKKGKQDALAIQKLNESLTELDNESISRRDFY